MTIILSEQGLTDSPTPYLYQQFIQHTGVLHKVNNESTDALILSLNTRY